MLLIMTVISCTETQSSQEGIPVETTIVQQIEVVTHIACDQPLEEVLSSWDQGTKYTPDQLGSQLNIIGLDQCTWSKVTAINPTANTLEKVLYFPKNWQYLECYQLLDDGSFQITSIGSHEQSEVLEVALDAQDTLTLFVKYFSTENAFSPSFGVNELSTSEYYIYRSKANVKFLLIGAMIFALLFFIAQFAIQKDKLSFYYLIFLAGSGAHLVDMLDTIPSFEFAPKIMTDMRDLQLVFLWSTVLTLGGLTKYIHVFLDIASSSRILQRMGHGLILGFTCIVCIPMIAPDLLKRENYSDYLLYFRLGAMILLLYILTLCIWAWIKKIRFSRVLVFAFLPFLLSAIWYALSFLMEGGLVWLGAESMILITGFMVTLLLFGVLLGVRSNAIKKEKIILEERASQLQQISQAKNRFYTNITHEFRTPLTVIKGMADQIKGQDKIRRLIRRNSDRLLSMVTQLLDLSKLETNSMTPNYQLGDIVPYLQYITESCHSLAIHKKLNLSFFSKEDSLTMDFDEDIMQHIVTNLVSNAIKFTPEYGSVKVITAREIRNKNPFLKLSVTDTGRGIPKDQLSLIFNRYYRVDDQDPKPGSELRTRYYSEGSGIGLALVKELVELIDGDIFVESVPEKGSQFHIYIPIHANAVQRNQDISIPETDKVTEMVQENIIPTTEVNGEVELPQLLIIEDNHDVIEYIKSCLRGLYQIHIATDGHSGVEKGLEVIPDVILSDVMMPLMDGFEVCRQLKANKRTSHIPIILLTAKATQEDKITGLSQGADAYLIKPFDKKELLVRLSNLTALSKKLQEHLGSESVNIDALDERAQREVFFLREVNEIIDAQMSNELFSTQHLCRAIAMSRTQLHRKLKALTDRSTAQYIRIRKLEYAKQLLMTSDLPIGEIAAEVGYKDFSHFSRSFAKVHGIVPSSMREHRK